MILHPRGLSVRKNNRILRYAFVALMAGVTPFAASVPARAELVFKGNWSATQSYAADDVVFARGSSWRAVRANVNRMPGSTSPDTFADWQLLAAGFGLTGEWLSTRTYHRGELRFLADRFGMHV
jgi:hypothetical protein